MPSGSERNGPKACVFCGGERKLTREHVIPSWLGTVLVDVRPPTGRSPGGKLITHRFNPGPESDAAGREWSSDVVDLVVKSVCGECNSGWLHDLETAARPIVTELVAGHSAVLSTELQRTIATWSYKTVLLMQLVRPDAAIPPHRLREFYELGRPPAGARVSLCRTSGPHAMRETSTEVMLSTPTLEVPGFFTALALGSLLVLCAGRLEDGPEQLRVGSHASHKSTLQVWPASVRPGIWPPAGTVDGLDPRDLIRLL